MFLLSRLVSLLLSLWISWLNVLTRGQFCLACSARLTHVTGVWSMKCLALYFPLTQAHHYHHYHHAAAHSAGLRPAPTRAHLQANDLSAFWVITNTNSSLVTIYYAQKSFGFCMNPLLLPAWSWIFHIYSVPTANCLRLYTSHGPL